MTDEQRKYMYNRLVNDFYEQPYEEIYNLISYAKLDLIADDSTWMCRKVYDPLKILLISDDVNLMIWIEHSHDNKYSITTHDTNDNDFTKPYYEIMKKQYFNNEVELYNALKKILYPCLTKKRINKVENKGVIRQYKTSLELLR